MWHFGDGTVSDLNIKHSFEKFRSGNTDLKNLPCVHAPSVIDDMTLKDMVEADSRFTVREIAERTKIH